VQSLVGLGLHRRRGGQKVLSFFVCPPLFDVRDCAPDFAMKALEYRNDFDNVRYRGRIAVMHVCSTFSDRRQLATPQNAEKNKMVKYGVFAARWRQINRWRRNLARRHSVYARIFRSTEIRLLTTWCVRRAGEEGWCFSISMVLVKDEYGSTIRAA